MTATLNLSFPAACPARFRSLSHGASLLASVLALLILLAGVLAPCVQAEEIALDHWPDSKAQDMVALQRGARTFVSYCLNCHSARQMRWNRLHDIGFDDAQIKAQLIFGEQKVGDVMNVAMTAHDAKNWFGKAPPDLSVIVRARSTAEHRGTDYLYTLFRGFYRDRSTLTGWNNTVYPNIAMPNILWQLQGPRTASLTHTEWEEHAATDKTAAVRRLVRTVSDFDAQGQVQVSHTELAEGAPGFEARFAGPSDAARQSYDDTVADLVVFLNWMSEPAAAQRHRIGIWVMVFLAVFLAVAHWLNKVYWRDIT